jgi:hypothetical protein
MNPLHLTTAQLLLIHEWCDKAEQHGQEQAFIAEKDRLWELCAQLVHRIAECQTLRILIATELLSRGTHPLRAGRKPAN